MRVVRLAFLLGHLPAAELAREGEELITDVIPGTITLVASHFLSIANSHAGGGHAKGKRAVYLLYRRHLLLPFLRNKI
jgi:hypothetical protein